jgi:hypothetical protein
MTRSWALFSSRSTALCARRGSVEGDRSLRGVSVARHDRRPPGVAIHEELIDVPSLSRHRLEREVWDEEEEVDRGELCDESVAGIVHPVLSRLPQQPVGAKDTHLPSLRRGGRAHEP